jgi:two-component system copper resistance phosphate regulon response regulator CusR
VLALADLRLDPRRHQVTRAGRHIVLGTRAFAILELMLRHPGRVFTRGEIVSNVWGSHERPAIVDAQIRELRVKIDEPFAVKLIHTERGVGYRMGVVNSD